MSNESGDGAGKAELRWLPLESNPEVMNSFLYNLGLSDKWAVTDVFGMEPELLAMVPQPVVAVLLLFPLTETVRISSWRSGGISRSQLFPFIGLVRAAYELRCIFLVMCTTCECLAVCRLQAQTASANEDNKIKAEGQVVSPKLYFMRQTISNACGTVALMHSLANNREA